MNCVQASEPTKLIYRQSFVLQRLMLLCELIGKFSEKNQNFNE
jgi:hypothetical protein